jgi:hypothetical protein
MVAVRLSLLLLALTSALSTAAADGYEHSNSVARRSYALTAVRSVAVEANGLWSDAISSDETPELCARFALREHDVREFFRRARRASLKEYEHDLDMSRCHATGTIAFANGDHGRWVIDMERRGLLTLSDGRSMYFYCPKCRAKVFDAVD